MSGVCSHRPLPKKRGNLMNEIWKDVKGYEGKYQISNLGRVRSAKGILKPQKRQHGYLGIMLYGRGGHPKRNFKHFSVHRLVAEAFIPNPNGYLEVNHIDEDKTNNCVSNLEWSSRLQNVHHGTAIERRAAKQINGKCSKAIDQYTLDGEFVAHYASLAEAHRQTGFGQGNICHHLHGKSNYSHAYGYIWKYSDI